MDHQFQLMANVSVRNIFISRETRSIPRRISKELQFVHSHHCSKSSGFLVRIGFGEVDHVQTYLTIYDVRDFTITTLRLRKPQDMSHTLVSSSQFSILLPAAWDRNGDNVAFLHTELQAIASSILTTAKNKDVWADLYIQQTTPEQDMDDVQLKIAKLHHNLKMQFPDASRYDNTKLWPLVEALDSHFQDFRGYRCRGNL